jgi:hypothetical protein
VLHKCLATYRSFNQLLLLLGCKIPQVTDFVTFLCLQDTSWHLELLANYVAELSLLLYTLLSYRPSVIAASVVFVAKFMLQPTRHPWVGGAVLPFWYTYLWPRCHIKC